MVIDPSKLEPREVYKLLIGSVVPRPIAWVSTISRAGQSNLAPFSYFNIGCANPPTLLFCPDRRPNGTKKDTLLNVEATEEFVIHVVDERTVEAMNRTSGNYPSGVNEFEIAGLAAVPSTKVRPPRVAAAPIAFECRLFQIVPLGDGVSGGEVVIGRVVLIHVRDDVRVGTYIDLEALRPVARLAGNGYARVTDTFELQRPVLPDSGAT
jgi:flavin reductase (DIM6/NTAB) family NADH-FMN oxidoreductase RutF